MEEFPSFAADRMLGRLARWLRLLGADVLHANDLDGAVLLRVAQQEARIFLTRDKRLRRGRRGAGDVLFIESNFVGEQLHQVLRRFPFDTRSRAFTRCSKCNQPLRKVARQLLARRVPPFVFASQENFAQCDRCGRIYWGATHPERALRRLEALGL